jgi:hypothetical protein
VLPSAVATWGVHELITDAAVRENMKASDDDRLTDEELLGQVS